jgi:6-phosphogluconolactonase (cycloisomerase 2 family)
MLTISGESFGDTQAGSTITIGGTAATVQSWSDTSIVAAIPDLFPGDVPVVVTTGVGSTDPETVRVILPPRVYLENNLATPAPGDGFDAITVMSFDPATGALAELGVTSMGIPPQGFAGCTSNLVVHEGTRRLFASGTTGLAVFAIDPVTGMLSHVPGSPFLTGSTGGFGIDVDAAGNRLFQVARDAANPNISVFNIAPNGALAAVPGSPFASTPAPDVLAVSRDGTFVYANAEDINLDVFHGYSVTANGTLTPLPGSPFAKGEFSFSISRRAEHDQLYIVISPLGGGPKTLQVWQPAPGTGIPTQISGSPFPLTVPAGTPHFVTFTPDGSRAYIGVRSGSSVIGLNLSTNGTPTPIAGSPFDFTGAVTSFTCMQISRDGAYLIANDEGGKDIGVFELAADGTPTQVTGSPFMVTSMENASGLAITF